MDALVIVITALLALSVGGGLGYLIGRSSSPASDASADSAVIGERDRALTEVTTLRGQLSAEQQQRAALEARLQAEQIASQQRLADLQQTQERLAEQFAALSADALKANREEFLQFAEQRLKASETAQVAELAKREEAVANLVRPLKDTLGKVETQLQQLEVKRAEAYSELRQQVTEVQRNNEQLKTETASLVKALRAPQARGRWGELQLRRIVELAGMTARADFDEQASVVGDDGVLRPDLVVRLTGGKNVVVDSKVTLAAYIEAYESVDEDFAEQRLQAHARHLRDHVKALSTKAYWTQFGNAPEFVILFVPGEAFLAPALERDPSLLEDAMSKKVIIATPTTLMSMLRTIAYAWQQEALADNARDVFELGRELYERLGKLGEHVDKLGRSVERVVKDYNSAVGSLETRVLVTARKLNSLEVVDQELSSVRPVDEAVRPLGSPELTASADDAARPVYLVTEDLDALPRSTPASGEALPDGEASGG
jgi:DNA anti-recombination protein RmuC